MPTSYRALCSDFYINQKLSVKLDLPRSRETVLELFERVRREFGSMQSFRRYKDELALESPQTELPHRWLAVRSNNIRSGVVNPDAFTEAYGLHRCVLEVAPYFLSISPLDVEYVELLFGFDLAAPGNHDAIVAGALVAGSPLASLLDIPGATPADCQPLFGLSLGATAGLEAHFEVKTRSQGEHGRDVERRDEPISIYLTLRRYDPVTDLKDLPAVLDALAQAGEGLVEDRVVPYLLSPIREAIVAGGF